MMEDFGLFNFELFDVFLILFFRGAGSGKRGDERKQNEKSKWRRIFRLKISSMLTNRYECECSKEKFFKMNLIKNVSFL